MLNDKTSGVQAKVEGKLEERQDGLLSKGVDMGTCPEEQDSCQAYNQPVRHLFLTILTFLFY